jgi:hypothetical protein
MGTPRRAISLAEAGTAGFTSRATKYDARLSSFTGLSSSRASVVVRARNARGSRFGCLDAASIYVR